MTLEQRIIALAQAIGMDIKAQATQRIVYETGIWIPSVQNATAYQSRAGRYTRIGQQVFLEGAFQLDSSKTGGALIEGLPYPVHPDGLSGGIHIHQYQTARAFSAVTGEITPGTSTIQILAATGPSTSLSPYANTFGKTGALSFSGHYTIA